MAQLIKLQDYVSRYEQDPYQYPARFIQLKKKNWNNVRASFEKGDISLMFSHVEQEELAGKSEEKQSFIKTVRKFFKKEDEELVVEERFSEPHVEKSLSSFTTTPQTFEDLKILFLENVFKLQVKWASSTLWEYSNVEREFYHDPTLKYFLQRFPDTYLVMYKPIFVIKKAPVEVDVVLIGPNDTWCISMIERKDNSVFQYSKERFWDEWVGDEKRKVLNPLIGLNRTEKIVRQLYEANNVELPIKKVVLSRTGYIDCPVPPYGITFVDRRNYDSWFHELRGNSMPLKYNQLKAAHVLLGRSQATYLTRDKKEELNE
ncbi:nuclease-related domain-containing protein [Bacillus sp. CGMCC 1.16541]|uniref:nuclease-related domain-containing protein n=1 Tax=Bacillus sp. CGMCC 1.16541 TaxID=2185143 RepID=UPI000D72AB20|nr:nuclease-related domain-containing protein [Bacillus sp. CGMCC 1.16541]